MITNYVVVEDDEYLQIADEGENVIWGDKDKLWILHVLYEHELIDDKFYCKQMPLLAVTY